MRVTHLFVLLAVLILAIPSSGHADSILEDFNEGSASSNINGTFILPTDVGVVTSADFSIYAAGRRSRDNGTTSWYYDNTTDLTIGSQLVMNDQSLSETFTLFTFSLDLASLAELNANRQISFTLFGESAYWESDSGSGYSSSRNYLDWAKLDFSTAATPIPGAVWLLGSGLAGLIGLRRKLKA